MQSTRARIAGALVVAGIVLAFALQRAFDGTPAPGSNRPADAQAGREAAPVAAAPPARPGAAPLPSPPAAAPRAAAAGDDPAGADAEFWRSADIEDFKRAIYAMEIESVDRIHLLEGLVHTRVEDPQDLWRTDWSGVDDWKERKDGFRLERADDGTLLFVPGEQAQRLFTFFESINVYQYNEPYDAFVHEVDYYGKPMLNVVKFLREDVLVLMIISGQKVDLGIYGPGAPPP